MKTQKDPKTSATMKEKDFKEDLNQYVHALHVEIIDKADGAPNLVMNMCIALLSLSAAITLATGGMDRKKFFKKLFDTLKRGIDRLTDQIPEAILVQTKTN